jgi:hypothetical protein
MIKIQKESAAHRVLKKLVDLGGTGLRVQLCDVVQATRLSAALLALESRFLIDSSGDRFKVTAKGKTQAAEYDADYFVTPLPVVARASTTRPALPYQTTFGAAPYREGSQDHRLIPSLIGDTRTLPGGEVVK